MCLYAFSPASSAASGAQMGATGRFPSRTPGGLADLWPGDAGDGESAPIIGQTRCLRCMLSAAWQELRNGQSVHFLPPIHPPPSHLRPLYAPPRPLLLWSVEQIAPGGLRPAHGLHSGGDILDLAQAAEGIGAASASSPPQMDACRARNRSCTDLMEFVCEEGNTVTQVSPPGRSCAALAAIHRPPHMHPPPQPPTRFATPDQAAQLGFQRESGPWALPRPV